MGSLVPPICILNPGEARHGRRMSAAARGAGRLGAVGAAQGCDSPPCTPLNMASGHLHACRSLSAILLLATVGGSKCCLPPSPPELVNSQRYIVAVKQNLWLSVIAADKTGSGFIATVFEYPMVSLLANTSGTRPSIANYPANPFTSPPGGTFSPVFTVSKGKKMGISFLLKLSLCCWKQANKINKVFSDGRADTCLETSWIARELYHPSVTSHTDYSQYLF